jgi:hypothetical protein
MPGCTDLLAQNFDINATEPSATCEYVLPVSLPTPLGAVADYCLLFKDVEEVDMEDVSFTMSYSIDGESWVFYHDYLPNFYFHTRERLFSSNTSRLFRHNTGPYGVYYGEEPKPFFIDVVFKDKEELILETVNWVSNLVSDTTDNSSRASEWDTLTHITIWNSQQHTGRIPLQSVFKDLQYETSRHLNGAWSFNDFRNALLSRGGQFLDTLFKDYAVNPNLLGTRPWYETDLMQDKYFIVRFEFDNSNGKFLTLHETAAQAIKAKR